MSTPARDNEEKFDRISYLPDELLCHVLSFLTTKEAALTSVLSKRWRNQLAFVPNLDLDDSVFLHPEEGKWDKEEIIQSFMDFVDRMLVVQGNSSIKKASLKFQNAVDSDRVNSWICNVLQRCVLDMDLYIKLGYNYRLPSEIFMSRTLVVLKISGRFPVLMRPGHFWLPMLKTLALDLVTLYGAQFQILLSACPALEELYMRNFTVSNGDETVSSPTLKTLTIKTGNLLHALSFDAPNLVYFKYSGLVLYDYPLVNLENLVEAHIKLQSTNTHNDVRKLVRGIRNIQKLYLSPSALEVVVALCSPESPRFNNLTFLDIDCRLNTTWQAMHVFLQKCPHLETLVFKGLLHHVTDECGDSCICISREEKGRSLVSCPVKRLEIREFVRFPGEVKLIKHFLDYFPCLKEMEIYITDGPTPQPSQSPLVHELNPEMLMRYNELSGRNRNVEFKVHGSLPWTAQ